MNIIYSLASLCLLGALLAPASRADDIYGSKHDLTEEFGITDACMACHGGAHNWLPGSKGLGRLGHDATKFYGMEYPSSTFEHSSKITLASVNTIPSDVPLCLSCHDGAYVDTIANGGTGELPSMKLSSANLSSDLSNDHPVGFTFDPTLDLNIKTPTVARMDFLGTVTSVVWCSSCHDVHNPAHPPFLRGDNTGSALCLDCHIK